MGAQLARLESSLSNLGVSPTDVDDIVLGWRLNSGGLDLYGFAAGRFNTETVAERARVRGLAAEQIDGQPTYCLEAGLGANCVLLLGNSLGAFGTLATLNALMGARGGRAPALNSNPRLSSFLKSVPTQAPIWGFAVGVAATDWFKSWMPGQGNVQLDWSHVFQGVEVLAYSVSAGDKVSLDMKLDCTTSDVATSLRQVLEGLKLVQQIAWQAQNPNRPNPFEAVNVELANRQVSLKLTTGYDTIEGVGASAPP